MSDAWPLAAIFLGGARGGAAKERPSAALERGLASLLRDAREAWPDLAVADEGFVRYLGRHRPEEKEPERWLSEVHGRDLYLSYACALGVPGALAAFERSVLVQVPGFVRRIDASPAFADEVCQVLREKLFVTADKAQPKIADYAGKSDLPSWVRTAALRVALNLRRSRKGEVPSDGHDATVRALSGGPDPEAGHGKRQYQQAFQEALKTALGELGSAPRNLLRLHLVDGLDLEQLAALFQITPSGVSRRLTRTREALSDRTRHLLKERLRLSESEWAGAADLVRSQLDLSLAGLLKSRA